MLGALIGHGVLAALSVSPSSASVFRQGATGTVYAGVEFNTSGAELANAGAASTDFTSSRGNWLDNGSSSAVWVERTLSGGSLNWLDPGAGRLQLNTTRQYGISIDSNGSRSVGITFDFYDAASGGNLLASVTINMEVEKGFV